LCFSFLVAGHGESYHGQGREERRKPLQTPLSVWILAAERGGGGAWRRRAATVPVVLKAFHVILDCFGAIL
jgi:hypothetical protein